MQCGFSIELRELAVQVRVTFGVIQVVAVPLHRIPRRRVPVHAMLGDTERMYLKCHAHVTALNVIVDVKRVSKAHVQVSQVVRASKFSYT